MKKLIDAIKKAVEKMEAEGITGWGLDTIYLDEEPFGEFIQVGSVTGCEDETCNHVSHDPAAPVLKWIPPAGWKLSRLGDDGDETYYYLTDGTEEFIIVHTDGGSYYDDISWAEFDYVPEYILARLGE